MSAPVSKHKLPPSPMRVWSTDTAHATECTTVKFGDLVTGSETTHLNVETCSACTSLYCGPTVGGELPHTSVRLELSSYVAGGGMTGKRLLLFLSVLF